MIAGDANVTYQSPAGPVANAYEHSRAELAAIVGPTGSGKTDTGAKRCLRVAQWQQPSPLDGIRKARVTCVTPTYRHAWRSVIPSFQGVMEPFLKDKRFSSWNGSKGDPAEFVLHAHIPQMGKIHLEVHFRAVGDEALEDFMRGLQTTAFWLPEMDTQPEALVGMAQNRCGRYPAPKDRPETGELAFKGVFGDANVPDIDTWFFDRFWIPGNRKEGDAIFIQPPGRDDASAENYQNLRKIDPNYYANLRSKQEAWQNRRFIDMKPGYSRHGLPVHEDFDDVRHVSAAALAVSPHLPVLIGVDGGGNTLMPAAVFGQRSYDARWSLPACVAPTEQTSAEELGEAITRTLNLRIKRAKGAAIIIDPAAMIKSPLSKFSYAQQLQAKTGIEVFPAPSNALAARRGPLGKVLRDFPGGKPALQIDGMHCGPLIRALAGGFSFPMKGRQRGDLTPIKNQHSHVAEACEYLIQGGDGIEGVFDAALAIGPDGFSAADMTPEPIA